MAKTSSYGKNLTELFDEINEHWKKEQETFSPLTEESAGDLSLPKDSPTTLCLFVVPRDLLPFYASNVFPTFSRYGFEPITYLDVVRFGENILAKISSVIERVSMVVIDASSDKRNYQYELALALDFNKKILIIKDETTELPTPMERVTIIQRPRDIYSANVISFLDKLSKYLHGKSPNVDLLYNEPERLLNKREFRTAVISAFSLLESVLLEKLLQKDITDVRMPFIRMINFATKFDLISHDDELNLRDTYIIRNQLVHRPTKVSDKEATEIVHYVMQIVNKLRNSDNSKSRNPRWDRVSD